MVHLVGAGPGDPGLITIKGRAALRRADVVLYDYLAPAELLELAPPAAERIYVGKHKGCHAREQDEITALIVERARRGLSVVRLKGGDPFIFGRGGEEVEALAAAGIPFDVIPGVPAPVGLAAYCGVPLTHRAHASSLRFVSGHDVARVDWSRTDPRETVVVFMGLTTFPEIARAMLAAGRAPATPAMAVRWATTPAQRVVVGTLATLAAEIARAGLEAPATIVIGEVVKLRQALDWFGRLPLSGRRVAVTGDAGASALRRRGAEAVRLAVFEYRPLEETRALDDAIAGLRAFDGAIFRSPEAVRYFLAAMARRNTDVRAFRGWIAARGRGTARALKAAGLLPDCVEAAPHGNVLIVGEPQPGDAVAATVTPYRLVPVAGLAERARGLLVGCDAVVFTRPAEAAALIDACGAAVLSGTIAGAVGRDSLDAARALGVDALPFSDLIRRLAGPRASAPALERAEALKASGAPLSAPSAVAATSAATAQALAPPASGMTPEAVEASGAPLSAPSVVAATSAATAQALAPPAPA